MFLWQPFKKIELNVVNKFFFIITACFCGEELEPKNRPLSHPKECCDVVQEHKYFPTQLLNKHFKVSCIQLMFKFRLLVPHRNDKLSIRTRPEP